MIGEVWHVRLQLLYTITETIHTHHNTHTDKSHMHMHVSPIYVRLSLNYRVSWCSVLGVLVDYLNTSLDIGLSITFKAGELILRRMWGPYLSGQSTCSSSRRPSVRSPPPCFYVCLFFSLPAGLLM